jgi:hypothetical protein
VGRETPLTLVERIIRMHAAQGSALHENGAAEILAFLKTVASREGVSVESLVEQDEEVILLGAPQGGPRPIEPFWRKLFVCKQADGAPSTLASPAARDPEVVASVAPPTLAGVAVNTARATHLAPPLPKVRRTGDEPFHRGGGALGFTIKNFWAWSSSDLMSNALRGRVAEFLVAQALGVADGVRSEWDAWDLTSKRGTTVEVKSAAYIQTWAQRGPSTPAFDIGTKRGWSATTNVMELERRRQASVYVFAILAHRDRMTADPLDVDQWEFYVLPSKVLDARMPTQKSIRLTTLATCGAQQCRFEDLAEAVERAAAP